MKRKLSRPGAIVLSVLAPAAAIAVTTTALYMTYKSQAKPAIISYDSDTIEIVSSPKVEVGQDLSIEFKIKDEKVNTNCIDFDKFSITVGKTNANLVLSKDYTVEGSVINIKGNAITAKDLYIELPYRERKTFADTEWKHIVSAIHVFEASSQSEVAQKALCSQFNVKDIKYIDNIGSEITDPNRKIEAHLGEFIGKTKNVTLNKNTGHQVRIIGINHDEILDENGKQTGKYATFTFDSVQLLSSSTGSYAKICWDVYGTNYSYYSSNHKSTLYQSLNAPSSEKIEWNISGGEDEEVVNQSVYAQLSTHFATDLGLGYNPIKKVNKQVATCDNPWQTDRTQKKYTVKEYPCYCFSMTYEEMAKPEKSTSYSEAALEGFAYAYWTTNDRTKKFVDGVTGNNIYYLTSPNVNLNFKNGDNHVLNITTKNTVNTNTIIAAKTSTPNYTGVSFAFCI